MKRHRSLVSILSVAAILGAAGTANAAPAGAAHFDATAGQAFSLVPDLAISVHPTSGPPGQYVLVQGRGGWGLSCHEVDIQFRDGIPTYDLGRFNTTDNGSFNAFPRIPVDAVPGGSTFTVYDILRDHRTGNCSLLVSARYASFTVTG
jgi:hypothetical protein